MTYYCGKLYRSEPDALGAPSRILLDAVAGILAAPERVRDVGCGQGRDALPLARTGHTVVGIDLSTKGIDDLMAAAEAAGQASTGQVDDITRFRSDWISTRCCSTARCIWATPSTATPCLPA